jgi:hypothetical protein
MEITQEPGAGKKFHTIEMIIREIKCALRICFKATAWLA